MSGGISPNTALWLNVAFLILTGIGAGSYYLGASPDLTTAIKGYATDAALAIGAINIVFHAFASRMPGVLTTKLLGS